VGVVTSSGVRPQSYKIGVAQTRHGQLSKTRAEVLPSPIVWVTVEVEVVTVVESAVDTTSVVLAAEVLTVMVVTEVDSTVEIDVDVIVLAALT
jgi:hypothetical protein